MSSKKNKKKGLVGRIAEKGKHDELVKKGGIYARFIDSRKEAVSWKI